MVNHACMLDSKLSLVSLCVTADLCHTKQCGLPPDKSGLKDPRQEEEPQGDMDYSSTVFYSFIYSLKK